MRADAERARDEQERDQARADRLEFREAVRVSSTGRPTGQPPRKQNDKVAQKVCKRKLLARQQIGVLSRSTSFNGGCVSSVKVNGFDTTSMMGAQAHARGGKGVRPKKHKAKHPFREGRVIVE